WPLNLSVFYPFPGKPHFAMAFAALVVLAGITVLTVRSAKKRPYLLVGWLWYLGTLVPVIGWIQVGSQSMADRYTYLPLIGLFIMIVWGAAELLGGSEERQPVIAAVGAVGIVACGLLASRQLAHWRDSKTLFNHAASVDEQNYMAWAILADLLRVEGQHEEAE